MAKTKEEREESKQVREMRKQIIRLKKENAQLRRLMIKGTRDIEDLLSEYDAEEEKKHKPITTHQEKKIYCQKCGAADVHVFDLIGTKYFKCEECGGKGKFKS